MKNDRFLTFKDIEKDERFPFTVTSLRSYAKNHPEFRKILSKVGRQFLIKESDFIRWIESKYRTSNE